MKKYIFIDIDGTLLNSKGEVTNLTQKSLVKAKKYNYEVILCTGRSVPFTLPIHTQCEVSPILVVCTGTQIYDSSRNQFLYQTGIPIETVDLTHALSKKFHLNISYTVGVHNYSNTLTEGDILLTEDSYGFIKKQLISRCSFTSDSFEQIMRARKEIEAWNLVSIVNESDDVIRKTPLPNIGISFTEVASLGTSKGNAVSHILALEKEPCYSYAIGNSMNDISMLEVADVSIAMGNAEKELKKKADFITKSNDCEGVSHAIEWILSRDKKRK